MFIHTKSRLFLYPLLVLFNTCFAAELALTEAEQLALNTDPVLKGHAARYEGLSEQAVADGQLPDPKLKIGITNLPVDTFRRGQEAMTQLRFGILQSIPPGQTLRYRREQTRALALVEEAREKERKLNVIREVRLLYFELYYQLNTERILQENRTLFSKLRDITERQYAAGRESQHDVLRAQLELSLLDDRIFDVTRGKETLRGQFARYISHDDAERPLTVDYPHLPSISPLAHLEQSLSGHPLMKIEDALTLANEKKIREVEQSYKPGFSVDVSYGERTGTGFDGRDRPDFLSAMLLVDVPLFTAKRQDKRLIAAKKAHTASQFSRADRLLEIRSLALSEYANWQRQGDRLSLYEKRAVAEARSNSESTLNAYQNDLAEFNTLVRALLTELNTQLDMLRIRIDRSRAAINLLYLSGEQS